MLRISSPELPKTTDSVHNHGMHDSGVPAGRIPVRVTTPGPVGASHLDEMSKAIIEKLQHDGRQSYAGLGKAVALSEAAVRQRVHRLIDAGVMHIIAVAALAIAAAVAPNAASARVSTSASIAPQETAKTMSPSNLV